MDEVTIEVQLGEVGSNYGKMKFAFVVGNDGSAFMKIYAFDPSDLRKSGIFMRLHEDQYQKLWSVMFKADETIEKLRLTGQVKDGLMRRQ